MKFVSVGKSENVYHEPIWPLSLSLSVRAGFLETNQLDSHMLLMDLTKSNDLREKREAFGHLFFVR